MLTENMLWAWNVVFVCNTESIFLCVSTSEAEPPLLHITTLTTEGRGREEEGWSEGMGRDGKGGASPQLFWPRTASVAQPRQTRQNCLVSVSSASPAVWTGFPTTHDCRRQTIWSLNTLIQQLSNSHRHARHDWQTGLFCRIWCGGVNWA